MNSNTAALQTGHHHHHHQSSSSANSLSSQQYHPSTVSTQQAQQTKPAVNPNPSVHRYNSLNENPWLLQAQAPQQQGPTPPLRQHKRPAPTPPTSSAVATAGSSQPQLAQKPNLQHLSVNSAYNQPVYLTSSSAQTQTTPGLAPTGALLQQHSPKSPNQNFLHQPVVGGNLMSTSLSSNSSSNMVNNHHHLPQQPLSTSLHHSTSSSLSNNNNNNNFDDLNLNGSSSISGASTSNQKKIELKLNTMP
jgi:hypothetical protein